VTRIELVIFDVGGTVIRDTANVGAVFSSVLKRHGIVVSDKELSAMRGASKRRVIEELAARREQPGIDTATIYRSFQEQLLQAFAANGVQPIPGIEEMFRSLRNQSIRTALTTGFDRRVTEELLSRLKWNKLVDCVVTADDVENGRPAPDMILHAMRQTGITNPSIAAAAHVGAAIGVLTGAHDRKRLESVPHTAILQNAPELPQWLADHP